MEYEKKYKDAQKWIESIYAELSHEHQMEAEAFFTELKESKRGDTREELISFLEELSKLGRDTNFDKWTTSDCAKWVDWVQKQDPTWFEEELEKAYKNGYEDAKHEILGLVDIESMAKAYEQRLINTMSNHPNIKLSVASFIHGANCVLDELYLKQCQVKESDISQHETKTCEENIDFSTSEDEKIRKDIVSFLRSKNGYMNPCEDWDFHNRWIPWIEKQGNHKTDFRERYNNIAQSEWFKETYEDKSVSEEDDKSTPKFKVGDWVILDNNHNSLYLIEKIENYQYFLRHYLGGAMPLNFSDEEGLRNWTVQDGNDGDVLVCESKHGQAIGIVKDYVGKQGGCDSCFDTYCFVDWDGKFRVGGYMGSRNIHPATKEQRDTLNKVLKDEQGLVYNFAKKELTRADDIATSDKE